LAQVCETKAKREGPMKASSALIIAATMMALPALADPPAPATTADAKTTVEGVTVTGKLPTGKNCRETDKACLLVVAKQIWDQYPHEIALYCQKERMRAFSNRMNKEALFGNSDMPGTETNISSRLPAALEVVCSYKPAEAPAHDKPVN